METKTDISFFTLTWLKIKKYWKYLTAFIVGIIGLILLKQRGRSEEILRNARENHEKELAILRDSASAEKEEKERVKKKYQETIDKIEKDFGTKVEEISAKKKKMIHDLVSDPEKKQEDISRELAAILGAEFIENE